MVPRLPRRHVLERDGEHGVHRVRRFLGGARPRPLELHPLRRGAAARRQPHDLRRLCTGLRWRRLRPVPARLRQGPAGAWQLHCLPRRHCGRCCTCDVHGLPERDVLGAGGVRLRRLRPRDVFARQLICVRGLPRAADALAVGQRRAPAATGPPRCRCLLGSRAVVGGSASQWQQCEARALPPPRHVPLHVRRWLPRLSQVRARGGAWGGRPAAAAASSLTPSPPLAGA